MTYEIDPGDFESVSYGTETVGLRGSLLKGSETASSGIILFPEWWGIDDYALWRATRFAEAGHSVFVADMYGDAFVTTDPTRAASLAADTRTGTEARERAKAGLDAMTRSSGIPAERIAAVGYCFGGSVALELARSGAALAGAVACHASLATPMPARPGEIAASILALHGDADPLVPSSDVDAFRAEMDQAGADWQIVVYGGAQHSFTRPDADGFGITGVAYHPRADDRSWKSIDVFLSEVLEAPGS